MVFCQFWSTVKLKNDLFSFFSVNWIFRLHQVMTLSTAEFGSAVKSLCLLVRRSSNYLYMIFPNLTSTLSPYFWCKWARICTRSQQFKEKESWESVLKLYKLMIILDEILPNFLCNNKWQIIKIEKITSLSLEYFVFTTNFISKFWSWHKNCQ